GLGGEGVALGAVGQVAGVDHDLEAGATGEEIGAELVEAIGAARGDDQGARTRGELQRQLAADARGGAGDERGGIVGGGAHARVLLSIEEMRRTILLMALVWGCTWDEPKVGKSYLADADGTVPAPEGPTIEVGVTPIPASLHGPVRLAIDRDVPY